jgi:hypothetical protein
MGAEEDGNIDLLYEPFLSMGSPPLFSLLVRMWFLIVNRI